MNVWEVFGDQAITKWLLIIFRCWSILIFGLRGVSSGLPLGTDSSAVWFWYHLYVLPATCLDVYMGKELVGESANPWDWHSKIYLKCHLPIYPDKALDKTFKYNLGNRLLILISWYGGLWYLIRIFF